MLVQFVKTQSISRITLAVMLIALMVEAAVISYETFTSEETPLTLFVEPEMNEDLKVRGAVVAKADLSEGCVAELIFSVAIPEGGEPVNFTMTEDVNADGLIGDELMAPHTLFISYIDDDQRVEDLAWAVEEYGPGDGDALLEDGETFRVNVGASKNGVDALLAEALTPTLSADTRFTIEVRTPGGEVLRIQRTTPSILDPVMNLS